jgi:hypothetical protein
MISPTIAIWDTSMKLKKQKVSFNIEVRFHFVKDLPKVGPRTVI